MIDLFESQIGDSSTPNSFISVDLPEPLEPTITPILKFSGNVGKSHG
jgi:hypothetical protein